MIFTIKTKLSGLKKYQSERILQGYSARITALVLGNSFIDLPTPYFKFSVVHHDDTITAIAQMQYAEEVDTYYVTHLMEKVGCSHYVTCDHPFNLDTVTIWRDDEPEPIYEKAR